MKSMNPYKSEKGFRYKLIALMLDNLWMARYGDGIIIPEYFETDEEESIVQGIIDYRNTYSKSPIDPDELMLVVGDAYADTIYRIYDIYEQEDLDFAADNALKFAKEQAVKLAILASVDDIDKGDLSRPITRLEEALTVGDSITIPGIDPIADVDKWLYDYWSNKIKTGMLHVDMALEGGMNPGELGVILAPQNRGKSMALVNIGYGAAAIGSGKNVVHFTHEMSVAQTAKRYASRILFRFPKRDENLDDYADDFVTAARRVVKGKIRIIGGKMTVGDMGRRLNILRSEGFVADLVIDDYGDLLVPSRKFSEKRFELSDIYNDLRQLGCDHEIPVWTASQSRRSSHSKEVITLEDMAEDINKTSIADIVISVCQTKEEEDADLCRLFMAKVRDGKNHSTFSAKYFTEQQAIVTIGIAKDKEDDKDV